MATCYRHPNVETGVSCSNCGNPICPDCMTTTPVGMRCPDCSRQKTKVRTAATLGGAAEPRVTVAIIVACVIAYLANRSLFGHFALRGYEIADGEYWRLVTTGFMHGGWLHLGFNMYLLWIIGRELELSLGSGRFAAIYGTALLWGSMGALAQTTTQPVGGASGAVFGIVGAMMVELRRRGMDPFSGGLGALLLINLAIGFVIPNIAWGGHVGGLIGGVLAALAFGEAVKRRNEALGYGLCGALSAVAVAAAIAIAQTPHSLLNVT